MNGETSHSKSKQINVVVQTVKKSPDVDTNDQKYIYKCQYCRVKFAQNSHYHRHMSSNHSAQRKEATYQCDQCRLVFSKKNILDSHCRTQHKAKTGSRCHSCSLKFKSRYCLRRHLKLKQLMVENTCGKCDKIYSSKELLVKHMRKHVDKNTTYRCDECIMNFKVKRSLSRHVSRIHVKSL